MIIKCEFKFCKTWFFHKNKSSASLRNSFIDENRFLVHVCFEVFLNHLTKSSFFFSSQTMLFNIKRFDFLFERHTMYNEIRNRYVFQFFCFYVFVCSHESKILQFSRVVRYRFVQYNVFFFDSCFQKFWKLINVDFSFFDSSLNKKNFWRLNNRLNDDVVNFKSFMNIFMISV